MSNAAMVVQDTDALPVQHTARPVSLLRRLGSIAEIMDYQRDVREMVKSGLKVGVDFSVIPGTQARPKRDAEGKEMKDGRNKVIYEHVKSLLQPGAQKIAGAYGLRPRYRTVVEEVNHFAVIEYTVRKKVYNNKTPNDKTFREEFTNGTSLGLYRYLIECELVDIATGEVRGSHLAACSSLESKYINRPRESENTIVQMGGKRAFVGAVRNTFGLSDEFTQDMEEDADVEAEVEHNQQQTAERFGVTEKLPVLTLADAVCVVFPGKQDKQNPYGGKQLGDVPVKYLRDVFLPYMRQKAVQYAEKNGDGAVALADQRLITAAEMIVAPTPQPEQAPMPQPEPDLPGF